MWDVMKGALTQAGMPEKLNLFTKDFVRHPLHKAHCQVTQKLHLKGHLVKNFLLSSGPMPPLLLILVAKS